MQTKPLIFRTLALSIGLAFGAGFSAFAAPPSTLQPAADGTVTDSATGLIWKRCPEGQTWSGTTCTGTAATYTFDQANALTGKVTFAGQSDWRMPNIRELLTLVDERASNPVLSSTVFPSMLYSSLWSGSPNASNVSSAWYVSFYNGAAYNYYPRTFSVNVLLVRGGQSLADLNLARPNTDYVDGGDGTVTHKPTNLTWQRCLLGQSWDGYTCLGTATRLPWDSATAVTSAFAGKSDWRLPTRQELSSLVDYTKTATPALNSTIFPNDLASTVWSTSSTSATFSSYAWYVDFGYNGGSTALYDFSSGGSNGVRLVRGGQSSAPLPLSDADCFLNWAEAHVPNLLTSHLATKVVGTISYRGAYTSGVYLGVNGISVLAVGGSIGTSVVTLGALSDFLPTARAASCK